MENLKIIVADFTTQLATKIAVGETIGSLSNNLDDDSVALPSGSYCFTLDDKSSQKEHIICDLSGKNLTNIKSVSRQGALTNGVVREHRVGCPVKITDFSHIRLLNETLKGNQGLDGSKPLFYDTSPTFTDVKQLATKGYVDNIAIAGSPDASTTTKGISKLSTAPVSSTNPIAVGDNDTRIPTQSENDALVGTSGTPSSSNKFVTNDDTGTSGANKCLRLDGSGKLPAVDGSQLTNLIDISLIAGENITSGQSVIVGNGLNNSQNIITGTSNYGYVRLDGGNTYMSVGQSFTTGNYTVGIQDVSINMNTNGSPTSMTASVYLADANDRPTGSSLGSKTVVGPSSGTVLFTFSSIITLSPNTKYIYVITASGVNAGTFYTVQYDANNIYSGGKLMKSTDGITYTEIGANYDLYGNFTLIYLANAGQVYKTNATVNDVFANNFIGFANETVSSGNSVSVRVSGVNDKQSGLSTGTTYYLQNTSGQIGTSAGSQSRKVGLSISSTKILIKLDNN